MVQCFDGGLVGRASRKQIAIAGLRIQQTKQLIERRLRGLLRDRRAAAVADAVRLHHRRFHRAADLGHIGQRGVHQIDARHDVVDRVVETADRRHLRIQTDGDTAIEAEPGIGC